MDIKRPLTPDQRSISTRPNTDSVNLKPGKHTQLNSRVPVTTDKQQTSIQTAIDKTQQKLAETIRQTLPIQQAPADLFNQLINNKRLPTALKQLAQEILNSSPQLQQIDDEQVKKSLSQSGLFLEAKLAQNKLQPDLKSLLLKFQQILKQEIDDSQQAKPASNQLYLIKELLKKTEGSLAKIILNQLASLPKDEGNRQTWILDIPFFNQQQADNLRLEINHKSQSNNEEEENWTVNLTLTPPGLATIHCKISYSHQSINTVFFSDDPFAVDKINQHLDDLKKQFEKSGLTLGHLSANHGIPPERPTGLKQQNLFDQKA